MSEEDKTVPSSTDNATGQDLSEQDLEQVAGGSSPFGGGKGFKEPSKTPFKVEIEGIY